MHRKKPDVDVIRDILEQSLAARPDSTFLQSLSRQYEERGGLSRKQLQGLHHKASGIPGIAAAKLATLEAVIRKMPVRYKSEAPPPTPLYERDPELEPMLQAVLDKYPQHKRVLELKRKFESDQPFSPAEKSELQKFVRLLT